MKKQLVRILALMLVLCLTPIAAPTKSAAAEDHPVLETLDVSPIAMASLSGEMFAVCAWMGIIQKVDGGWKLVMLPELENGYLDIMAVATADETLYLLTHHYINEISYCVLMRTHLENGALTPLEKVADVDVAIDSNYFPQFYGMAADKDNVYFLMSPESGEWGRNDLYRVSLRDGTTTHLAKEHLTGLTHCTDGKLLALYSNDHAADRNQLVTVDKETGAIEKLCSLSGSQNYVGLTYDGSSGFAYFSDDSQLYRYASGWDTPAPCANYPPHNADATCIATVWNGMYYLPDLSLEEKEPRVTYCAVDPS